MIRMTVFAATPDTVPFPLVEAVPVEPGEFEIPVGMLSTDTVITISFEEDERIKGE